VNYYSGLEAQGGEVDSAVSGTTKHQEGGGSSEEETHDRAPAEKDPHRTREERGGGRCEEAVVTASLPYSVRRAVAIDPRRANRRQQAASEHLVTRSY